MARPRPPRRTQRQLPSSYRPAHPPCAVPSRAPYRTTWASACADADERGAAIGKVARFGDAPRAGRVRDVIFELESGDVLAYEVDAGDGTARFVPADLLERETPSTLHFAPGAGHVPEAAGDEFLTLEHLPPGDDLGGWRDLNSDS